MTIHEADPCGPYAPAHPDGRLATCSTVWVTETVVELARGIRADEAFDRLPILADALEEAGCDDLLLLGHCRFCQRHLSSCWVVEAVMEGFDCAQPIVVPIPPSPTAAGRLLDALREELQSKSQKDPLRPRHIPYRDWLLARYLCVGVMLLTAAVILITLWFCGVLTPAGRSRTTDSPSRRSPQHATSRHTRQLAPDRLAAAFAVTRSLPTIADPVDRRTALQ